MDIWRMIRGSFLIYWNYFVILYISSQMYDVFYSLWLQRHTEVHFLFLLFMFIHKCTMFQHDLLICWQVRYSSSSSSSSSGHVVVSVCVWMMPVQRVVIPIVVLLLFGALLIACGLGVVPYVVERKIQTVGWPRAVCHTCVLSHVI